MKEATETKRCSRCGYKKALSDFTFCEATGRHYAHCFDCFSEHKSEYLNKKEPVKVFTWINGEYVESIRYS